MLQISSSNTYNVGAKSKYTTHCLNYPNDMHLARVTMPLIFSSTLAALYIIPSFFFQITVNGNKQNIHLVLYKNANFRYFCGLFNFFFQISTTLLLGSEELTHFIIFKFKNILTILIQIVVEIVSGSIFQYFGSVRVSFGGVVIQCSN